MKSWLIISALILSSATIHFSQQFDSSWESRWVQSDWKTDGSQGKFNRSAGKWFTDSEVDQGLQTPQNAKFYSASAKFPSFSNTNKPLVIQFTVKNEQNLDCGGGYIKLLPQNFDQSSFGGETPYLIMFGPDKCGSQKRTHLILPYQGKNYLNKKQFKMETDNFTHLYTAIIKPDNTFQFLIDNQVVQSGTIQDYWQILQPKEIKDPDAKKPENWVDEPTIEDPDDVKPEGWDDISEFIVDTSATKPEDWNDQQMPWEAPKVPNPEYKGEWRPKRIPNPDYQGPWTAPLIANPNYKADSNLYEIKNIGGVGIQIWQVTAGSIFDNIFVGDDLEEAKQFAEKTFGARKEGEKSAKEAFDAEEAKLKEEIPEPIEVNEVLDFEPNIEPERVDL